MNIYWCNERYEYGGLYVVAQTRGRAKALFAQEIDCDYKEVRSSIRKRGIKENFESVITEVDDPLLKKYGLKYCVEEEEI